MKDSGCEMVLIGFESINSGNLKQMNKEWTARLGERDELIEKIHEVGISIYASFVFGFDEDTEESFIQTLKFAMRHQFFVIAFNHLLTFPIRPLTRLSRKKEGSSAISGGFRRVIPSERSLLSLKM